MNKYLLMLAAAVLGGSGAAHARTYSFTFATAYGYDCDGGIITTHIGGGAAATCKATTVL